jgi:hypothetical protein
VFKKSLAAKIAVVPSTAALLALVGTTAAEAAAYSVYGTLNTGGYLVQYSTYRTHSGGGSSLKVTDNVAGYSRFGLRNTANSQISNSNEYHGTNTLLAFKRASNGSLDIPTGSYALNGRMAANSGGDNYWAGTLNL